MKMVFLIVILYFLQVNCNDYSFESFNFNDWGSGFYEKPVCKDIPSNMSLCNNINYKQMKVPNLLGHETLSEIEYQSSVWTPLVNIQCHPDTQLFLCSLFAPICLEHQIKPCRSLCESVRDSCEDKMKIHSYSWPSMFDCSQFPEDNGLCIPSTVSLMSSSSTTSSLETLDNNTQTTTTNTYKINRNRHKISQKPKQQCNGCIKREKINREALKNALCSSEIAVKGKIQSYKSSYLEPILKSKKNNNMIGTKFITISKRNRKILHGNSILAHSRNYLKGLGEFIRDRRRLDIFIFSDKHLNLTLTRSRLKYRFNRKITLRSRQNEFCSCNLIENTYRLGYVNYLVLANTHKIDNSITKSKRIVNYNIRRSLVDEKDKLFYLTSIVPWNRAKRLLRIKGDDFDIDSICNKRYS